jgi:hypothetical protein
MAIATLKTAQLPKPFASRRFSLRQCQNLARSFLTVVLAVAGVTVGVCQAQAGTITVSASDNGTDLTLAWTGSWDITASYPTGTNGGGADNYAQVGSSSTSFDFLSTPVANVVVYALTGLSGSDQVTVTNLFLVNDQGTATGNNFRVVTVTPGSFTVEFDRGYVSGTTISGTATIPSQTVSGLFGTNLDSGSVTGFSSTLNGTTNSVVFQAVPEPSTYAMLIAGGLAMGGAAMRRRRRLVCG